MLPAFALHRRKLGGTRQAFNLAAKISSFVEVWGLYVQVERDLDNWKHISCLVIPQESLGNLEKGL